MKRSNVKICGLTQRDNVDFCISQHVGYLGFIAVEESPRYVDVDRFNTLVNIVPAHSKTILVTRNHTLDEIATYMASGKVSAIQLHGDETPTDCSTIKARFNVPIIKAFAIKTQQDVEHITRYQYVDTLLFDTKKPDGSSGGAGTTFNWNILRHAVLTKPWFLSGGLHADNVKQAVETISPPMIDLSSSVESAPGIKDHAKISDLLAHIDRL